MKIIIALMMLAPAAAFASKIAVIDSGTDYRHKMLVDNYAKNTSEIEGNKIDDDNNGYIDDVLGWNFAENNNLVIDYSYLGTFSPDVTKFFEVQTRVLLGTATQEDKDWMKSKRGNDEFIQELQKFGNFAHGTHVSGISVRDHKDSMVFAAKIIPTEVKMPGSSVNNIMNSNAPMASGFKEMLFKMGLSALAKQNAQMLTTVGGYVGKLGADVANGSFGTSSSAIKPLIEQLYNAVFKEGERNAEQLDALVKYFLETYVAECKPFVDAAPNTLFVFAAGNDGTNNDELPTAPANVKSDNTITVAATLQNKELASFSNFGEKMVDVAAPGVGILSAIPGSEMMVMSGTSQAAPYVTNVAAEAKSLNPELRASDLKMLIMATVDSKGWLKGKVKAGGFVNPDRVFMAAKLSRTTDIYSAIAESRRAVRDMDVDTTFRLDMTPFTKQGSKEDAMVQPLPSQFR